MSVALQDQKVVVTGGTSGIGQAIAMAAARAGANVAFCGLTSAGADVTRTAIEQCDRRAYFEALDLTDLAAARRFARNAIDALGGLDALVNNAGADFYRGVRVTTHEDIERALGLNFYPAWAISQEVYPALKEAGGGVVVNIASVHAERTIPGAFPYNVSKAALVALTKSLAIEWGRDNIRAVAVAPAHIFVPLTEAYLSSVSDPSAVLASWESRYPVGRVGRPEEVAALVVSLLGEAGRFVSGTTIFVDGGISALMQTPDTYLHDYRRRAGQKHGGLASLALMSRAIKRRARTRFLGAGRH